MSTGPLKVILVRLCECEGNVARIVCTHGPLTDEGRKQAAAIRKRVSNEHLGATLAPDNTACRETADLIAAGGTVNISEDFREPPYPAWSGKTYARIEAETPAQWARYLSPQPGDAERTIVPDGECFHDTYARLKSGLDEAVRKRGNGEAIVIVTHGENTRLLILGLLGAPLENLFRIRSDNGSLSIFSYDGQAAIFEAINDTSHLTGLRHTDLAAQAIEQP